MPSLALAVHGTDPRALAHRHAAPHDPTVTRARARPSLRKELMHMGLATRHHAADPAAATPSAPVVTGYVDRLVQHAQRAGTKAALVVLRPRPDADPAHPVTEHVV